MYGLYALGLTSPIVILPIALVVTVGSVFVFNTIDARRKDLPAVMPTVEEVEQSTSEFGSDAESSSTGLVERASANFELVNMVSVVAVVVTIAYLGSVLALAAFSG
ncbi:hypothetical protein GCM10008985_25580 [Halococcus dombrowskii]